MRKFLSKYYAVIMMILFIVYNLVLDCLKIGGLLYQIFMIVLVVANFIILVLFRKNIKFKSLVILIYFCIWFFSKNTLQCIFSISSMIVLMITGFMENIFIKVITVFITIFFGVFSMPLLFVYLFAFGTGLSEEREKNYIYDDMHYYCSNNYEVYSYSAGAMDSFNYSIVKYYDILDIDGIIYISYNKRNEVSREEYERFLKKHKCNLVGDINGSE